jgi:hypothetical protein
MLTKWEYRLITSKEAPGATGFRGKSRESLESYLNELGDDGWEVVAVDWNDMEGHASFSGLAKRVRSAP